MNCIQRIFFRRKNDGRTSKDKLPVKQKFSHGVGHILNDLAASVWFSYLIIYLTKVAGLSNRNTGLVVFLGQIADAVFTPFIGIICDRTVCRYGRRKVWHLIGTVLTSVSFPMLFIRVLPDDSSTTLKVSYFVGVAAVFQFGWGSVQISHLSLIPEICHRNNERVELNAIRSALTFICGIYVYTVTWILLGENSDAELLPSAWKQFMYLSLIIVGTGNFFNLIFHAVTKEPKSEALLNWKAKHEEKKKKMVEKHCNGNKKASTQVACQPDNARRSGTSPVIFVSLCDDKPQLSKPAEGAVSSTESSNASFCEQTPLVDTEKQPLEIIDRSARDSCKTQCKTKKQWLKDPNLYKVAVIYMCTRLVVNISQSYLPLYLTDTMQFQKEAIAYFPLVVLISGVLASVCVKPMTKKLGSKVTYCIGTTMALGACVWYFIQSIEGRNSIYATTVLMGTGGSIMLVTALSLISEMIGHDKKSGAFIYGAISFTDKLSSGAVIAIIQELNPRKDPKASCPGCGDYVRYIQSIAPGAAAVVALFTAIFFFDSIFSCKRKVETRDASVQVGCDEEFAQEETENHETEQVLLNNETQNEQESQNSNPTVFSQRESPDNTTFTSIEARNLTELAAPVWYAHSARRLANPGLPSPLVERRTIV